MTVRIPQMDVATQYALLRDEIDAAVLRVVSSGRFILGDEVAAFESEVASFLGVRHAVSCASGTDALSLALHAAGVSKGDEVITTSFSFIAAAEAIVLAGATPVFADIDRDSFNMTPASAAGAVTERTKAMIVTHLYGCASEMDALQEIADRHGLILIEDCAQSFGATYGGRQTGSLSFAGCFSFYPTKNIGACGDGGLTVTNDADVAERLRRLRNHGMDSRGVSGVVGWNSRLDEIQAAVLRIKLRHAADFIRSRRRLADMYIERLSGVEGLKPPMQFDGREHAFNQFTVLCERRDELAERLKERGVLTRIYYDRALPDHGSMRDFRDASDCEMSRACSRQCLSFPMYPELSDESVAEVAAAVRDILK